LSHRKEPLDAKRPLAQQVWDHEKRARELGLQLVVELHTNKEPTSKAIDRLWSKERKLTEETLEGIYLVRVDLVKAGAKEVMALTPYALFGVPLFIGWNPLGQVLTRAAFRAREPAEVVLVLSAFFNDVAHGRRHTLNPPPMVPSGSSPRPRRVKRAEATGSSIVTGGEELPRSEATAKTEAPPTLSPIAMLAANLEAFLANALSVGRAFLKEHDLRDDLSLHSLRQLDALLDENPTLAKTRDLDGGALAAIGVYLGCVVAANAKAEWFIDTRQQSPIEAVSLRVLAADRERVFRPIKIALDRLHDLDKGFYGHAVDMARQL
jgi:hypothetical protein